MNRVTFNTKILQWALDRYDIPSDSLEGKYPDIEQWLSGDKKPTFKQLQNISKDIHLPFGYLFMSEPPKDELGLPLFRTLDSEKDIKVSAELRDTIYAMKRRQLWLNEYQRDNDYEKLNLIGKYDFNTPVAVVASDMKETLGFVDKWARKFSSLNKTLSAFREHIENAGITIVFNGVVGNNTSRKLRVEDFRGFVLVDEYAPLVFVNSTDAKCAQMFTIAHELAHLWYGKSAAFDLRQMEPAESELEIRCNKVAAEFLVPAQSLRDELSNIVINQAIYADLANVYKVSELVIARRLLDLQYISKPTFFNFLNSREIHETTSTAKGGDFYNNQNARVGRGFMLKVLAALNSGALLPMDAFRLTDMFGNTFDRYARKITGAV